MRQPVDCELKERRHEERPENSSGCTIVRWNCCRVALNACETPQNAHCGGPEEHHSVQHLLPTNLRPTKLAGGADDCVVVEQVNERLEWTTSLCIIRPKSRSDLPLEVVVQLKIAAKVLGPQRQLVESAQQRGTPIAKKCDISGNIRHLRMRGSWLFQHRGSDETPTEGQQAGA